ncbi:MAG TPA: hypothetical protein VNN10_16305, partial [Dehalococcoidia bacterium]|nr:hypothetical protein [Dehalococcoidia bacterium]
AEARRLRDRLHQLDRRIGKTMEAVASARMSREKLRTQGLALAQERLKTEEDLRNAEWRAEHYASAAERRKQRSAAIDKIASRWESLSMEERQDLLREVLDRVVVTDDEVRPVLRP